MGADTRRPEDSRGGAPEALCDVLARSFAMLLRERSADGRGDSEGDAAAADSGTEASE